VASTSEGAIRFSHGQKLTCKEEVRRAKSHSRVIFEIK